MSFFSSPAKSEASQRSASPSKGRRPSWINAWHSSEADAASAQPTAQQPTAAEVGTATERQWPLNIQAQQATTLSWQLMKLSDLFMAKQAELEKNQAEEGRHKLQVRAFCRPCCGRPCCRRPFLPLTRPQLSLVTPFSRPLGRIFEMRSARLACCVPQEITMALRRVTWTGYLISSSSGRRTALRLTNRLLSRWILTTKTSPLSRTSHHNALTISHLRITPHRGKVPALAAGMALSQRGIRAFPTLQTTGTMKGVHKDRRLSALATTSKPARSSRGQISLLESGQTPVRYWRAYLSKLCPRRSLCLLLRAH